MKRDENQLSGFFFSSVSLLLFLSSLSSSSRLPPPEKKHRPHLPRRLQQSLHEVCLEALGVQTASLERRAEVPDLHLADGVGGEVGSIVSGVCVCVLFRRHFSSRERAQGAEDEFAAAVARW